MLKNILANTSQVVAFNKLRSSGSKMLNAHCNYSITTTPLIYVINVFLIKVQEERGEKESNKKT